MYPPSHQSWLLASGRYDGKSEILLLVIRCLIKTCKVEGLDVPGPHHSLISGPIILLVGGNCNLNTGLMKPK